MAPNKLGIIGGSGLYDLPGLADTRWVAVDTPWGAPSDELFCGRLADAELIFLPRHGRGHRIPPGEVNYRANIAALKSLGVTDVLSLSAVGGLREELPPGTFVVVDQFVDRTFAREKSFFGASAEITIAGMPAPALIKSPNQKGDKFTPLPLLCPSCRPFGERA